MTTRDAPTAAPKTAPGNHPQDRTAHVSDSAPSDNAPAPTGLNDPRTIRFLQIAVVGMGIVLLIGIGVVIARIVYLATRATTPSVTTTSTSVPAATSANSPALAKARLVLPNGARIQNMSLSGNRLAIYFTAPTGAGIRIIDTTSGAVLRDIQITPEPPTR